MNFNWASVFLALHLSALVFWLGPTLGAWMVLREGEKHAVRAGDIAWVWRAFLRLMWWEHGAFIVLIASGVGLILSIGYSLATPWLKWKLGVVLGVLVPVEIVDSYFAHYRLPKIYGKDAGPTQRDTIWVNRYHRFTGWMIPLFLVLIPLIFYFAVFKPLV